VALLCMQLWASLLEGSVGSGGDGGGSGDGEGEGGDGRESEGRAAGGAEKDGDKETASAAVLISTVWAGLESLRARGGGGGEADEADEAWLGVFEAMLCRALPPPPPATESEAERPKVKPPEGWGSCAVSTSPR
jgi:hypothetical protein